MAEQPKHRSSIPVSLPVEMFWYKFQAKGTPPNRITTNVEMIQCGIVSGQMKAPQIVRMKYFSLSEPGLHA
eukprot:322707-Rhodomonas_salina.2